MGPRRDWSDAIEKRDAEACRVCGRSPVEAAHVTSRRFDRPSERRPSVLYVHPDSIIALCPDCHGEYDRHELDIISYLETPEQVRAVEDYGSIDTALRRLAPVATREAEQAKARIIELEAGIAA